MSFHNAKKRSIVIFSFACALLLVNCTAKTKTVNEKLIGTWQLKSAEDAGGRKVTFTYAEDKSCTYEFFEDNAPVKKETCYYLLLNDEKVIATYYDNMFVEIQEQFDIVKLDENKLELKERKVDGQSLSLEKINQDK
jgi:hypothetical protein